MSKNDNMGRNEPIKRKTEVTTEDTLYYTISGKEEFLDSDGNPSQSKADKNTLAKHTGIRYMIKIDDRGRFINPNGLYVQHAANDRFIDVNKRTFDYYLSFLRTKRILYFNQAEREAI